MLGPWDGLPAIRAARCSRGCRFVLRVRGNLNLFSRCLLFRSVFFAVRNTVMLFDRLLILGVDDFLWKWDLTTTIVFGVAAGLGALSLVSVACVRRQLLTVLAWTVWFGSLAAYAVSVIWFVRPKLPIAWLSGLGAADDVTATNPSLERLLVPFGLCLAALALGWSGGCAAQIIRWARQERRQREDASRAANRLEATAQQVTANQEQLERLAGATDGKLTVLGADLGALDERSRILSGSQAAVEAKLTALEEQLKTLADSLPPRVDRREPQDGIPKTVGRVVLNAKSRPVGIANATA
jgi:hypothetical protein